MSVQHIPVNRSPVFKVEGLTHSFGYGPNAKCVLGDITFSVDQGEFMCIVGPSGIGKTTLLRSLSGLLIPRGGTLVFNGTPITEPPADLAVVFQDYSRSLMPWLSILDNVTLPLHGKDFSKKQRDERGMAALEEVNIAGSANKYPWQLSGGMQQRAAIARALAYRPAAILMDEPFASVDAQTRADLEDLVLSVRNHLGITVLLVTHDIDEAVYLSDKVCVLSGSPAKVARVIDVDLGRERDQIGTKATSVFTELRAEVLQMIRRPNAVT